MTTVKRFRKLGEITKNEPLPPDPLDLVPVRKTVRRFATRATRSDKNHRFTLRIAKEPWGRIKELFLNCNGGSEAGASLNIIVNLLLEHALNTPEIIESIQMKYPQANQIIKIRTWG